MGRFGAENKAAAKGGKRKGGKRSASNFTKNEAAPARRGQVDPWLAQRDPARGSAAHEPRRHRRALSLSCDLRASTRSSFLIPCAASLPSSPISPLSSSHSECENDAIRRRSRKATFSHDPLPHPIRLPNFQLYSELLKLCLLARLHPLHPPPPCDPACLSAAYGQAIVGNR